jgi:hypothetical protein
MKNTVSPKRQRGLFLWSSLALRAQCHWRWLVLLLLLIGLPVLLHGCHGDEDNELLAPFVRHVTRKG